MLLQQLAKFILVGILNTAFGYSVYAVFIFLGFNYVYSMLFATGIGAIFNFKTIGALVFDAHEKERIYKFFLVYIVIYFVNIILIKVLMTQGANPYLAGALALIPSTAISFVLNKYFVFKR